MCKVENGKEEELPLPPYEFEVTPLNGIKICHRSVGDPANPAVLLINGISSTMAAWPLPLLQTIVDGGYRVIMFDNRGAGLTKDESGETKIPDPAPLLVHGANPDFRTAWCIDDMADDAVAVLDHYGVEKAHIVGVSMGGLIAQNVAVRYSERCRTFVPIMTSANPVGAGKIAFEKNPEWFGKLKEVSAVATPTEGMSVKEIIKTSMPKWKHIRTDEAYPNWRPVAQDSVEEFIKIDFERGGIDWGGKGMARQTLAVTAWGASSSKL